MEKYDLDLMFKTFAHGVAHRGLHDDKRPENSKAAFVHAIEIGLPFETDVHLTIDGKLIINHDNDLARVTGKSGVIEQLSFEQIKKDYRLQDGSQLLSLSELLSLNQERVPVVLELKAYEGNEKKLHEAVKPYLDSLQDPSKLVLISFFPLALQAFKDDRWNRGLLIGGGEIDHLQAIEQYEFLDVAFPLLEDPRFLAYRKNGGKILSWTPRTNEEYHQAIAHSDGVTFERMDYRQIR